MLLGWVIYPTPAKGILTAFDWMIESAAKNGISLRVLLAENISTTVGECGIKIIYHGEEQTLPHFVLMRHYDVHLSTILEKLGVRVINSTTSMVLSQNKLLTHVELQRNHIPTPFTLYGVINYAYCVEKLGSPFVVKAIRGSKGEEVFLVADSQEFEDCKNEIRLLGAEPIAQKYIASSYGRDLRVWVIGERVVASVLRHSETSFKSNIALGGKANYYELPETVSQLAIDSCKAVGLELGGVDILFDGDHYTVCEVNGNAGFRAFSMAGTKVDIPNEIFKYISNLWKS